MKGPLEREKELEKESERKIKRMERVREMLLDLPELFFYAV